MNLEGMTDVQGGYIKTHNRKQPEIYPDAQKWDYFIKDLHRIVQYYEPSKLVITMDKNYDSIAQYNARIWIPTKDFDKGGKRK